MIYVFIIFISWTGLWHCCRIQVLSDRWTRRQTTPALREGLFSASQLDLCEVWSGLARQLYNRVQCVIHCATVYSINDSASFHRQKVPRRAFHMLRVHDTIWSAGLVLRARSRCLLPLPLFYPVCDKMCRVQQCYPEAVRRDQSQYERRVLASRVLHDQQGPSNHKLIVFTSLIRLYI